MAALKKIIRCGDGYIERIKQGAELLQAHGFRIEIDTILTKYNCDHGQLDDLYHYIKDISNLRYWEVRVPEMSLYNRETFSAVKASRQQLEEATRYVREGNHPPGEVYHLCQRRGIDGTFPARRQ